MSIRSSVAALALFSALTASPLVSASEDTWNGSDKSLHLAVSAALGTATGMHFEDKWKAFGVAMIPGIAKEVIDSQRKDNHFSTKDIVADAIGAALGVQLGHWIITSKGLAFHSTF